MKRQRTATGVAPGLADEAMDSGGAVSVVARAKLPAVAGDFELVAFAREGTDLAHVALVRGGALANPRDVPVHFHSECLAGDAFGSLRCHCRQSLEAALARLAAEPRGVLIYLRAAAHGGGPCGELRAVAEQERAPHPCTQGEMTAPAERRSQLAEGAALLRGLGISSVRLLAATPSDAELLRRAGLALGEGV